eukprot:scaffold135856_cov19-Prasinocladus_malaysianus.AAC.1
MPTNQCLGLTLVYALTNLEAQAIPDSSEFDADYSPSISILCILIRGFISYPASTILPTIQ